MQPIALIYFRNFIFSFTFQDATVCIIKRKEVTITSDLIIRKSSLKKEIG